MIARLLLVFASLASLANSAFAEYQTLMVDVRELRSDDYPPYIAARAEELKTMVRHGEITVATYAQELETLMRLTMRQADPNVAGLQGDGDSLFMDNYRRLAWDYGTVNDRWRSAELETAFVHSYANRVVNFVKYSSDLVGLFGDVIEGLGHIDNWTSESHQDKWESAMPQRWFGQQWTYMADFATEAGRKNLHIASVLSSRTNVALYDVRALVPMSMEEILDTDRQGVPEFLVHMYDYALRYSFVHFSDEMVAYLKERDSFLNLRPDILRLKSDACALLLRRSK